ncbi:MAG: hypothetical protein IJ588_03890 [Prevotella sp.]|nr:hypothetical protein [Prevotella sp.]
MKKRVMMLCLTGLTFALGTMAQTKAVRVESPIVTEKDFMWYTEQKEAWREATQRNPQDEEAWQNYYDAARYMTWWDESRNDTTARQVIREMREAIPNTYTYNKCAYMAIKLGHGEGTDGDPYAEAALTMLPDDMLLKDYNEWVCYLAMKGHEERMAQMAKRFFDSGLYSETVLRYSYNELAGMEQDGIYLSSGDAAIIPKWLIQVGMGMHRDKTIVAIPFLWVKEYREWLNKKLGIKLPEREDRDYQTNDAYERDMLQTIIDRYGSKVYFSSTTPPKSMEPWKEHLYNEGLLLKYSAKAYDNMAVKRRNVEERYMLEYLLVSFRPDWTTGQRLSANYAVLLADLLPYYAKHDQKRYDWLMRLLVSGVTNTSLDEENKQQYLNLLLNK